MKDLLNARVIAKEKVTDVLGNQIGVCCPHPGTVSKSVA
jgi:hypothetical protein